MMLGFTEARPRKTPGKVADPGMRVASDLSPKPGFPDELSGSPSGPRAQALGRKASRMAPRRAGVGVGRALRGAGRVPGVCSRQRRYARSHGERRAPAPIYGGSRRAD